MAEEEVIGGVWSGLGFWVKLFMDLGEERG